MIDTLNFQINILGLAITVILFTFLLLKKLELIPILALTSIFINIPIFNYKPLTFGFQIFFFFAIILILLSLKNIISAFKNKNFFILIFLISIFILLVLISLILASKNIYYALILQPPDKPSFPYYKIFQFSRLNITQFLYLLFYVLLFLSVIVSKFDMLKTFKYFLIGININFLFQIYEFLLNIFQKPIPIFLNNLSFLNESTQVLYLKDFNIYRFSGLIPTSSILGIYLTIALFLVLFFKDIFKEKIYRAFQILITLSSFAFSISSTFLLGSLLILLLYFYTNKNYLLLPLIFILLLASFYSFNRETIDIRLQAFLSSINIFLKYPIFGIGWGSHFADLFSSLLANTGISGFLSFSSIFIFMIAKTLQLKEKNIYNLMDVGLLSLFLTGIIWNGININILWIILGIWARELIFRKNYID
jgi:hypothetical protein